MRHATRLALGALVLAASSSVFAQSTVHDWAKTLAVSAVNTTPASLATVNGTDALFFSNANKVYALNASDGTGLNSRAATPGAGDIFTASGTIENFVSVVNLGNHPYLFVTDSAGLLYKVDVLTMTRVGYADLRRSASLSCKDWDSLHATPTVQLSAYSNSSWTLKGHDVVYAITYDGCGDTTDNQVIAFDANAFPNGGFSRDSSGTGELWTFGGDGHMMDFGSQGCSLDYDRNALYCGTNLPEGAWQPTLWAISTGQSGGVAAGHLIWSVNANAVVNRPQLSRTMNHLYVADYVGVLHAYDPDTGALAWEAPISDTPTTVSQNIWAEFRTGYEGLIFVTDADGVLHVGMDFGTSAAMFWNQAFSSPADSIASFAPTPAAKLYIGLGDGTMHQLDFATGVDEGTYVVGTGTDKVLDGVLQIASGASDIDKIIAISDNPSGVTVKRFTTPFSVSSGAAVVQCQLAKNPAVGNNPDCPKYEVPSQCTGSACCSFARCVPWDGAPPGVGVCASLTTGSTGSCDDGNACTTGDTCRAGTCIGLTYSPSCNPSQTCPKDPMLACGFGNYCVPSSTSGFACSNSGAQVTLNGITYTPCGSLNQTCDDLSVQNSFPTVIHGGERACVAGVCGRPTEWCRRRVAGNFSQLDNLSKASNLNASGIGFTRDTSVSPPVCTGYLVSANSTGSNFLHVMPSSTTTTTPTPTAYSSKDGAMHGVAAIGPNASGLIRVFTSFLGTQRPGGWFGAPGNVDPLLPTPGPMNTSCTTGCPFQISAFNVGPSQPTTNGELPNPSGVPIFFGNYQANGDVFEVVCTSPSSCTASSFASISGGVRVSALDMAPVTNDRADRLLKVAVGSRILYYSAGGGTPVYALDLASSLPPSGEIQNVHQGGPGKPWWSAGMQYIEAITSLAADPLNGTNDLYAEVRENRPATAGCPGFYTYVLRVRGTDNTVMPLADYEDVNCNTRPGLYTQLGLNAAKYQPPPMNGPLTKPNEGRLSAGTISQLYRLETVAPSVSAQATVTEYELPP